MNETAWEPQLIGHKIASAAIETTASTYPGSSSFGGLVLHIARQTDETRLKPIIDGCLNNIDAKSRDDCFNYIVEANNYATGADFWKFPVDKYIVTAGMFAYEVWKVRAMAEDKDLFREYQLLIFDMFLLNQVGTVLADKRSRDFVAKAVRKSGLLSKIFGS